MPAPGCPGLTRTEQLRQARTQTALREQERREMARQQPEPMRRPRRPPRPEPKKVDFTKPGLTKAMIAKMKHSEKFKQELERKAEATLHARVPRRTPAPIGGDARMGRERSASRPRRTPGTSRPTSPGPSQVPRATSPRTPVPRRTAELARMMNADVVQAEPVGSGPIENIVIPSGLVSDRPTIVNITPPVEPAPEARQTDLTNQSIQVINQTLDQQDAAEAAAVQNRLADLQQARRDFVIAVANVGGNAVQLDDEQPLVDVAPPPAVSPARPPAPAAPPSSPPVYLQRIPAVDEPAYGFEHPDVVAAMEHLRRIREEMQAMDAQRRLEEEFARIQAETDAANIPIIEDPGPEPEFYEYPPFDPDELERFLDPQRYPTSSCGRCGPPLPPPGREQLPRDLWELDDPWARPPPEPDVPDLIQFD